MAKITRRRFLATGSVALGGAAASIALGVPRKARAAQGTRWGMLIDLRRCIGCHGCSVACKAENDVPLGVFRRRVRTLMKGGYPKARRFFLPVSCFHCEKPACLEACPQQAIHKTEEGFVLVDKDKCITKKKCVPACPYNNMFINPEEIKADKCTFCEHRVKQGLVPACVQTCTGGAISFGDLNDGDSDIAKAVKANGAKVLKPEAGTSPSFYYIGVEPGMEEQLFGKGQFKPESFETDR